MNLVWSGHGGIVHIPALVSWSVFPSLEAIKGLNFKGSMRVISLFAKHIV